MLHPGLYEQVINRRISDELAGISDVRKTTAKIDAAEASKALSQYLGEVVQKAMDHVSDVGDGIDGQVKLANSIVALVQQMTDEDDFAAMSVDARAEQLLTLLSE